MKVRSDKAKTRSKTAREVCCSAIFGNRWPCSPNLSFALRSQVECSTREPLHRNENKENPSKEGERQGPEKSKDTKDGIRNRSQRGAG